VSLAEINRDNVPVLISSEARLLDGKKDRDLRTAAELLSKGEVIVAPICGVMGFVCDATQRDGSDFIYELKGRDRSQQLITAGSTITRQRLIAFHKLHPSWEGFDFSSIYDLPAFIIFPAADGLPKDFVRPDPEDNQTDTVAVWWANYYSITRRLESFLQQIKPDAIIGGSSCNRSRQESIVHSDHAFNEFGRGEMRVAAIVYDRDFDEARGLLQGSHGMLKISGDKIKSYRAGCVHMDSFKSLLRERLIIPDDFRNSPDAVLMDYARVRRNKHYLKEQPHLWHRLFSLAPH